MRVGLISPGAMGASIGAAATRSGAEVLWAGNGRSTASHDRAERAGLKDSGSLEVLVRDAEIILSVCPPHDAARVAQICRDLSFDGLFADCNAIAPAQTCQLAALFPGRFVDGGIIGGPAWDRDSGTCLYLSGDDAALIAGLFVDSPLKTRVISNEIGAASATKMAFAAYTKGSAALLTAILGVAEHYGVREVLQDQWGEAFTSRTHAQVTAGSAKAWRFAGEMREIAATFAAAGLSPGFHEAAADTFEMLARFKDDPAENIEVLLEELRSHPE